MITWLIGEAPAPGMTPDDPAFSSKTGQRMTSWLGQDVRDAFRCANLLPEHPGRAARGSKFPVDKARVSAKRMVWQEFEHHDRIILCGMRVAKAFLLQRGTPLLEWGTLWRFSLMNIPSPCEIEVAILPHPSGLNVWYNDPQNQVAARRFLRRELKRMESKNVRTG